MELCSWTSGNREVFDNREVVLTGKLVHGMPCVVLDDLWHLPCRTSEASILSDGIDIDELEL